MDATPGRWDLVGQVGDMASSRCGMALGRFEAREGAPRYSECELKRSGV